MARSIEKIGKKLHVRIGGHRILGRSQTRGVGAPAAGCGKFLGRRNGPGNEHEEEDRDNEERQEVHDLDLHVV